jgi:hypothetical protein
MEEGQERQRREVRNRGFSNAEYGGIPTGIRPSHVLPLESRFRLCYLKHISQEVSLNVESSFVPMWWHVYSVGSSQGEIPRQYDVHFV